MVASHLPGSLFRVTVAGQLIVTIISPVTVTVCMQRLLLNDPSTTTQVIVVFPTGNGSVIAPPSLLIGANKVAVPQLSDTVGGVMVTNVLHAFCGAATKMLAGQVIAGFSLSSTVTAKLQVAVLPLASVTVHITVVVPLGNMAPARLELLL